MSNSSWETGYNNYEGMNLQCKYVKFWTAFFFNIHEYVRIRTSNWMLIPNFHDHVQFLTIDLGIPSTISASFIAFANEGFFLPLRLYKIASADSENLKIFLIDVLLFVVWPPKNSTLITAFSIAITADGHSQYPRILHNTISQISTSSTGTNLGLIAFTRALFFWFARPIFLCSGTNIPCERNELVYLFTWIVWPWPCTCTCIPESGNVIVWEIEIL